MGINYLGYMATDQAGVVILINDEAISIPNELEITELTARMARHLSKFGSLGPGPADVGGRALLPYQPPTRIMTESRLYVPAEPSFGLLAKRFNGLGGDIQFFVMSRLWKTLRGHDQSVQPMTVITPAQYALVLQSDGPAMGRGTIIMERLDGEVLGVRIDEALNASRDDEAAALKLIVGAARAILQHTLTPGELALVNDLTDDDSGHNLEAIGGYADLFDPAIRLVIALLDQPHLSEEIDRGALMSIALQSERP